MDIEARILAALDRSDAAGAAEELVRGYGERILAFLRAHLEADAAGEVFAQFCEDALKGLPTFRRDASVRTWAFVVARNALRHHLRDPFRARGGPLPSDLASRLAASVANSGAGLDGRRDRLRRLRERLSEEERSLLALRVDRDLEWEEVATVLTSAGEPVSAAALRKRFERLTRRIERLARELGLLD